MYLYNYSSKLNTVIKFKYFGVLATSMTILRMKRTNGYTDVCCNIFTTCEFGRADPFLLFNRLVNECMLWSKLPFTVWHPQLLLYVLNMY